MKQHLYAKLGGENKVRRGYPKVFKLLQAAGPDEIDGLYRLVSDALRDEADKARRQARRDIASGKRW